MNIELHLYATLAKYLPETAIERSVSVEAGESARVRDLLAGFGIPHKSVKLIFVNGIHAGLETVLSEGDRVGLFPPVGGG